MRFLHLLFSALAIAVFCVVFLLVSPFLLVQWLLGLVGIEIDGLEVAYRVWLEIVLGASKKG